jgi:hypothetical protein
VHAVKSVLAQAQHVVVSHHRSNLGGAGERNYPVFSTSVSFYLVRRAGTLQRARIPGRSGWRANPVGKMRLRPDNDRLDIPGAG